MILLIGTCFGLVCGGCLCCFVGFRDYVFDFASLLSCLITWLFGFFCVTLLIGLLIMWVFIAFDFVF